MDQSQMSWSELVRWSEEHDLLAKRLYLVQSTPTNGMGPVLEVLDVHVAYQTQLERDGVMFAAGPLANDAETQWEGEGIFVYRAETKVEAEEIARRDPMHSSGARTFVVRPWLLNEGTFSIRLYYSGGRPEIV